MSTLPDDVSDFCNVCQLETGHSLPLLESTMTAPPATMQYQTEEHIEGRHAWRL